ncbi:MAG: hypothetical protein Q9P01_13875 [Anaerolineae bacterium]|nr:hypothetical protein [Anaerolineae bacterium]MDQ7035872.1 hypothetical protein [Anaerolineae bacterium]
MLLFTIKFVHSLILVYMLGCLYLVWQYGLTGFYKRWMPLALASVALEGAVFFGYGMKCPLTEWALALGDKTGSDLLMDILFEQPVNIIPSYITFFVVGLCVAGWRFWQEQKPLNYAEQRAS